MSKALRPIISPIKSYIINSVDIETFSNKNKFLLCGINFNDKYYPFTNVFNARAFIYNNLNLKNHYLVATNLQFDFNGIFYPIDDDDNDFFDFNILLKNGDYITARKDNIVFMDTIRISPFSVKNLGHMLGIEKLYTPKFLGKKPKNKQEWKYLREYNSKDCLISKKFIEYFQKAINELGGELKLTIASCAMNLFQRKYLKEPIFHERIDVKSMIFESYYGGRTECFMRGKIKDYNYYDFNSLYPSCMLNKYPLPSSCIEIGERNPNYISKLINKYEGVTEVLIEAERRHDDGEYSHRPYYPFLPYRGHSGTLYFPTGKWRGTYTNLELRKALTLGYKILKVYRAIIYTKTFFPFKDYVNDLYAKRLKYKKENNEIMSYACKILLNSLYGKFASKDFEKVTFKRNMMFDKDAEFRDDNGLITDKKIIYKKFLSGMDKIFINTEVLENNKSYTIPILSSYTTSYARIKLYDALVKLKGIYCDTDSIITKEFIDNSDKLGELKLEKRILSGIIIKPKAYKINDKIKFKGMRHLTNKEFNDIINDKAILQKRFIKIKSALRQNEGINSIMSFMKHNDLEDTKRRWVDNYMNDIKFNKNKLQNSVPHIFDTEAKVKILTKLQQLNLELFGTLD